MAKSSEIQVFPRSKPSESKASILLVDDNPANLLSLRAILEDLGQNLVEARSGEEAVQRVQSEEFAVVLLDVLMPGISGFETAKLIRGQERSQRAPIIFLTASEVDRPQLEKGYALGAVDFLMKPLLPVILQSKVRGFVELFQDKQRAKHEADQLRLLVHGTTEYAIFMLDPQGQIVTWNAGAERLKGYKADEIIGQHFSRFYPQDAIDRGWPAHELKVVQAEGRIEDEGWRVRKDGSRFWANVVITALRDGRGNLQGFSKVTRDLTARKQAEEALRRSEERFRLLVEGAQDYAIFLLNPQGYVASWNPGAERIKQYKADEIIGQHFSRFYPQEAIDRGWPEHELKVTAAEGRFEDEGWRVRKDGTQFWANVVITALHDDAGNFVGFSKITRDLTERKKSEENARRVIEEATARRVAEENARLIQEQRERLHVILASIGDGVISTDAEGRVAFLNPVAEELVGWKSEDAAHNTLEDVFRIVNEDTRQPVENPALRALKEGVIIGLANHTVLIAKDGQERPIDDSAAPIRDAGGSVIGSVLIFRDVTEQRRVDRELRESEQELADFFENATVGLHWVGPDGTILRANRAELDMLGYSREEYIGRSITDFHADEDVISDILKRLQAGEKLIDYPARLRCKDGTIKDVLIDSSVMFRDGHFIHTRCFTRDVTERKRAERELRESEQRFARFMQYLPGLAWIKDVRGRYIYANDAAERAFGTERAELYGKTDEEVFPPETAAQFQLNDKHAMSSGTGVHVVEVLEQENGVRHSLVSKFPILGSDGQVALVGGVAIDITEQRRVEQALRHSEERFRNLMDQAPFSIQVLSPDGRTSRVNRAWEELWGVTLDQIGDYNILEDLQLEGKGVLTYIRQAFAGEPAFVPAIQYDPNETLPDRTKHADPVRWVAAVAYPLKDDAGRVREVVLVHQDTTGQRRAEAALRESEEKFRLLADTIPQLAWMARPDGHIFWYNRRWYEYTGTTPEQMEGWGWQSVHAPDVLPKVLERWNRSIAGGEPFDMVFPLKGADDQFRPFLTRVNPLRDEKGRILYWFGTNTDISEIKRMEEALRETDRRKDEFLATLAHELRNPLAPIRNSLQILKMPRVDPATIERSRDMMERQVEHLVRLVDDLLDVSRVMRGKIELRRDQVELATVVAGAVETVQPLVDAQGHDLSVRLTTESLLIDGDPVRLAQVVGNLLTNAAKYTEPNGRIRLTAEREGDVAVLRVRDTGIGIASHMLPRIFELFVQVDHASTKAQGGLGIGLTLVKNLVEMHNGTVEARSEGLGKGSEFIVRLPLSVVKIEQEQIWQAGPETQQPISGYRLLVVDDNRDAADSLAMLLRLQGHEVHVAYSGVAALEIAKTYTPHVVFLDIGMPGMDGYEVARRIREHQGLANVVLAALTGWGQKEDRRRTAEAGFNHHLVKPPEPQALESILAALPQRATKNAHDRADSNGLPGGEL